MVQARVFDLGRAADRAPGAGIQFGGPSWEASSASASVRPRVIAIEQPSCPHHEYRLEAAA
jgi:hypothetical protein